MSTPREFATRIVARLRDAGHVAYFAGGCVRDELLGYSPKDFDVATSATPDEVRPLFRRVNEVGVSFGVMLVREDDITVEVATFREESGYSDSRRPDEVRFSDAGADAKRRDYTVNALFLDPLDTRDDPRGRVLDLVGGLEDLRNRIIRAVGDPDARLSEDHLRALRAVRLAARLGFTIEPTTGEAISRHATRLAGVSRERVGDEMRKMLTHPSRVQAAELLQRLRLDGPALDESSRPAHLSSLRAMPSDAPFGACLGAWVVDRAHASGEDLDELALDRALAQTPSRLRGALCLSNDERDALRDTLTLTREIAGGWGARSVAGRKRLASRQAFGGALCAISGRDGALAAAVLADVAALAATPSGLAPTPLTTGDDLVERGFRPGPRFKQALEAAYDAQLEGSIRTRDEAIALCARVLGSDDPR